MTTGHVYIAISLDGFVARSDHTLDWLDKQQAEGEEHGYEAFVEGVDGIVMGRGSYETVRGFDIDWPYDKPVVVMSKTLTDADLPPELVGKVRFVDQDPPELMRSLQAQGWSRAYVDGGKVVQSFMRCGLIEDLWLTIIPILIGDGVSLFGELDRDVDLELLGSEGFPSGLLQARYRIVRDPA